MWNYKNKITIFLLLVGFFNALCYAQDDATIVGDAKTVLDKEKTIAATSLPLSAVTEDSTSDLEKKKHKTTTTTTTEAPKPAVIGLNGDDDANVDKHKNKTTTTTTTTALPSTSTTSSTTEEPTTTSTTTTEKPTTMTTSTTSSTTIKPTTTTSTTTSTTTVKPTPTPTPKPNPPPKPDIGLWNCSCILLRMAAQVNFTYGTKDNKTAEAHIVIPSSANATDCDCTEKAEIQYMILEWGDKTYPNSLTLRFEKNNSEYGLYMLIFKIQSSELPNAKENLVELYYEENTFLTPLKMSYHCTRQQNLNLTSTLDSKDRAGLVSLMDLQFEAFQTVNEKRDFSTAKDCDAIDTPDIVPIAVGIALIALILIVLVSYLVARRRSTARGYMSF